MWFVSPCRGEAAGPGGENSAVEICPKSQQMLLLPQHAWKRRGLSFLPTKQCFSPPSRDNNDMKALRPRCVTDGSCLFCGSAFGSSTVAGILFSTLCRSGGWTLPCPQQSWSSWEHGGGVMAGGSLVTMTVGLHSAGRDGPFPCTFCVPFSLLQFRCFCTSDFELWCISLHLHLKAESLKIWGVQPWVCAGSSPSAAVCPVQLQSVEFLHFLSFNASLSLH